MNKTILILTASLLALACTLTNAAAGLPSMLSDMSSATDAPKPSPAPSNTPAPSVCIVTAEALNVRADPNAEAIVIGWFAASDIVTILPDMTAERWIYVRFEDRAGWIHSDFCERIE